MQKFTKKFPVNTNEIPEAKAASVNKKKPLNPGVRDLSLIIRQLAVQNKEKEDRAAELLIANKELAFQNQEKEDRAAELLIANQALALQNRENEENARKLLASNEELKEIQMQLIESNKELESFSYSVSHDLRAPLRAIIGYSDMLQEDYQSQLDAEAIRIISVIVDNAQMMSHLIDDLLKFSKMARLEVVNHDLDMQALVRTCISELTQLQNQQAPEIILHNLPFCQGDVSMLKQVWSNLIGNAFKYSSKKTQARIEIGALENETGPVYFIKDNGCGFEMKYYHKLFGVFQRLHGQHEFEGTGLGLALVKRILQKHGGNIWAESVPGNGAAFYFSLPKYL